LEFGLRKEIFEMLKTYPAIFHEEESGGYWIKFPEFGGATEGENLDEAMQMAKEFLSSILAYYIEEGKALPSPSDIKEMKIDNGFATLIQVDPSPYIRGNKTIRKNVSVPEWLAERAKQAKINVSEVLTEALLEKISKLPSPK
jgi:predicted RNase H-like HicB family nuclease